jgi:hypothetical protein
MEENILIQGALNMQQPFQEIGKLEKRIDGLDGKSIRVSTKIDRAKAEADIKELAEFARRAFENVGRGVNRKSNLITNIFDPGEVQKQIKELKRLTGIISGGATERGTNFNAQRVGSDIDERLKKAKTSSDILGNSLANINARLKTSATEAAKLAGEVKEAELGIAKASKTQQDFAGKIDRAANRNRSINPVWTEGLAKAEKDIDAYIAKLKKLKDEQYRLSTPAPGTTTTANERLTVDRDIKAKEKAGVDQEIERLEAEREAVNKLSAAYSQLGSEGKGIQVTQAALRGQLAAVNELISASELYNENEEERIKLFKAQQRILQGTKALTTDLLKANKELYEAPAKGPGIGIFSTLDANNRSAQNGFEGADDLIKKYSAIGDIDLNPEAFVNTKAGIQSAIAELKTAQDNVEIFGDKFQAIQSIIDALSGRLRSSLTAPLAEAGSIAGELITDLDRLGAYQPPVTKAAASEGRTFEFIGNDEAVRQRKAESAIVPFDQAFADVQSTIQRRVGNLISSLDSLGAYQPPATRGNQFDSRYSREIRLEGDPSRAEPRQSQFPIVPFDPNFAKRQRQLQEEIELSKRLANEKNRLAKSIGRSRESAQFKVEAGVVDEIERLAQTAADTPASIKLISQAAKELAPLFREGSDEAERLQKVLESLAAKKTSPFFDLKSLDSYAAKIAELKRVIGSSEIGSEEFVNASRELGVAELGQRDQAGQSFGETQGGKIDYFRNLIRQAGSAEAAIEKIFSDFQTKGAGLSEGGISSALGKISDIRNAIPTGLLDSFDEAVTKAAASLGILGNKALGSFGASERATRAAAEEAEKYNNIIRNAKFNFFQSPGSLDSARKEAGNRLSSAIPGGPDARSAISDLGTIDFNSTLGNLENLKVKTQELGNIEIAPNLVDNLREIAREAEKLPGVYNEVKSAILGLNDAFIASGSDQLPAYESLVQDLNAKSAGPGKATDFNPASIEAYNKALEKARKDANGAAITGEAFSKALARVAAESKMAAQAQSTFNKELSKNSAKQAASELEGLKKSGLSLKEYIEKQFEGSPRNKSGIEGRIEALKEKFGDLDFSEAGAKFKGEFQQTMADFMSELDAVSFQNIESDLLDLGQLFKDVFGGTFIGNIGEKLFGGKGGEVQPGLLAAARGGPKALQQRAAALSPGSRRGLSEALIGGGFPLLFGQGAIAAGGGLAGGLIGPWLLGGGGGFAGSIVGTAIGQALQNLATNADEISKALLDPVANLEQLAEASLIATVGVEGLAKGLIGQGKKAEAAAVLEKEIADNPILRQIRDRDAADRNNPLIRGINNAKAEGNLFLGETVSQGLGAVEFLAGIFPAIGGAIGGAIGDLFSGSGKNAKATAARFDELGKLAKEARGAADSLAVLASSSDNLPTALKERVGIVERIGQGNAEVQEVRSQLAQENARKPALRDNEKIAELETDLLQKQKERTVESQKSLGSAEARLAIAERELSLQQKVASVGNAGREAFSAFESGQFNLNGAREAERQALTDIIRLTGELESAKKGSDEESEININLNGAKEALAIAKEQVAIERKITLERVQQAKLLLAESQRNLDFARSTSGLVGTDLENANENRLVSEAGREYNEIASAFDAASLKAAPESEELQELAIKLEAAANKLEEAGISIADNIVRSAGESAQRFLAGILSQNSLSEALGTQAALASLSPGTARGQSEGSSIALNAQNSIVSAGQNLIQAATQLRSAEERAQAAGNGAVISQEFYSDVERAGQAFQEAVVRSGNDLSLALSTAKGQFADSSNNAGKAVLANDSRVTGILGGVKAQFDVGSRLIEQAFKANLGRFREAFGFEAYRIGGQPLNLEAKAQANDIIGDLVSKMEQAQQSEALVNALTQGASSIQASAQQVAAGLFALESKNWNVSVFVNGQSQGVNLG